MAAHGFLKRVLPARAFEAIKAGTKEWLMECPCDYKRDIWDSGGIRYRAAGQPRRLLRCPKCGKATWHRIRKKTEAERAELR